MRRESENALLRAALEAVKPLLRPQQSAGESAREVAELKERGRRQTAELEELAARVEAASVESAERVAGVVAAVDADRASFGARSAEGTARLLSWSAEVGGLSTALAYRGAVEAAEAACRGWQRDLVVVRRLVLSARLRWRSRRVG